MGNFWRAPANDQNDVLQPLTAADERVQNDRQNENPAALVPEDQPSTEEEHVQHENPPLMPGEGDQPSAEERVLQRHYDDLRRVIVHPLGVATQLVQEGVASSHLVEAVNRQGITISQKNVAILDAVCASIHSDPERFEVVMGVLESSTEAAPLVRKMKKQLSTIKPVSFCTTERLTNRRGWWYTVPDYYRRDYNSLQASFGTMFYAVCKEVKLHVSVHTLKRYLYQTFAELEDILQEADTIDQVMKALRSECSLTECSYFENIASQFNLKNAAKRISDYHKKLDSFCQHTLADHLYVKSFREDYPKNISTSNRITFRLQWNAREKTLKDIRNVLYKAFGYLSVRVEIVVIQDGSVVVVCWAPQHLMEELVRLAKLKMYELREMGVVKLTIGDTEVELDQQLAQWQRALERQFKYDLSASSESVPTRGQWSSSNPIGIDDFEDESFTFQSPLVLPASIHEHNIPSLVLSPKKELSYKYTRISSATAGTQSTTETRSKSAINPPLMASKLTQSQHSSSSQLTKVSTREGMVGQQIITGLKRPHGLVLTQEGHLIVAESLSHCITIINITSGEKIISFGQCGSQPGQFWCPRGVAVTQDGYIVVADSYNHRLQVLTVEGAFVSAVGSKWGSEPLQFYFPQDVAVHHNGKIYVTDQYNYRVQVLNPDLTYSHSFGKKGDHPGEFDTLQGVTIDSVGNIYVAETFSNSRVQKFTPEGTVLAAIDHKKKGTFSPHGLCVDSNNILYAANYINNTVEMFSTGGQYFGHIDISRPECIVLDHFGRLYISSPLGVIICKPYRHYF